MSMHHVLNVPQPVINQAELQVIHRSFHTTTAVMPNHDHMTHFQYVDRILQNRQAVEVSVNDNIRNIPMYKHVTGMETNELG